MRKFFIFRALLVNVLLISALLATPFAALGQKSTSLEVFANPDGAFQFLYPENYDLLVGERILKATQGNYAGLPVCDFSTALVCVIYPIERQDNARQDNARFEAAGFSVDAVPGVTTESECLAYSDRLNRPAVEQSQPSSMSLNGRVYQYASAKRTTAGHSQFSDLYRTFQKERCYELRIAVSLLDESAAQTLSFPKSLDAAEANRARESLKLVLATFSLRP